MEKLFENIDPSAYGGRTVFLDVDGTLLADGESKIKPEVSAVLRSLASNTRVILLSNSARPETLETLKREFSIEGITHAKKPSLSFLERIPSAKPPYVVMGDKWLIDGILALRLGAEYVPIKRIVSYQERPYVRLTYALDNVLGYLIYRLWTIFA